MIIIKNNFKWILLVLIICSGLVSSEEIENGLSENERQERAIFGGHGHNEFVGGGSPGKDFPTLSSVPRTDFSCSGRIPGYYADEEYGCQVFHICHSDRRKDSFLCPNGTIFHQLRLVCDWWYNVDCSTSDLHVSVNNDIGKTTPSRRKENDERPTFSTFIQDPQRKKTDSFQRHNRPTQTFSSRQFGVPLRTVSDISSNAINEHSDQFFPENEIAVHVQETFPPVIQPPPTQIPITTFSPIRSSHFVNNVTPRSGVTLRTFSHDVVTPRARVTPFSNNVTPRTGVPLPTISSHFVPRTQINRVDNRVGQKVGVELPSAFIDFNNFRSVTPSAIHTSNNLRAGIPLPPQTQNNINTFPDAIVPPEHFTVPKSGVSLSSTNSERRGSRGRVSSGRRILINKTPITSRPTVQRAPEQRTNERQQDRPRIEENSLNAIDNQGPIILEDDKIATQFFTLGQPRRITVNRQPISTTSNVGRPLPQTNNIRGTDVSFQTNNLHSNNRNTFRNNIGVALPTPNIPPRNNIVQPAGLVFPPSNFPESHNVRKSTGLPLLPNGISQSQSFGGVSRGRISSSNVGQTNLVSSQRSGVNVNRGSTTFLTSRNRQRVNQFVNNQLNRPSIAVAQPARFAIRDFDDDILDDLDDLNDPFDDDRFDDDRFDKDRFELDDDDRFDDDRFDKKRFDLDDHLDKLEDKLEDQLERKFGDDDRFDLDDKFDDDRFDKDRFESNDRFDDIDDKLDDLFDFDDEIDDRLKKFGNDAGFNFGRRPRGSTFQVEVPQSPVEEQKDEDGPSFAIKPPPEIQLPPPPP